MYDAACKVEFQPFKRLYSQLTFFNFLQNNTATHHCWQYLGIGCSEDRRKRPHLPHQNDRYEQPAPVNEIREPAHEERRRSPESEERDSDVAPQLAVLLLRRACCVL